MLAVCGDAATVKFDPSGKDLFITDRTINSVEIAAVKAKSLAATDSIPGIPALAFSRGGKIVYAIEDKVLSSIVSIPRRDFWEQTVLPPFPNLFLLSLPLRSDCGR